MIDNIYEIKISEFDNKKLKELRRFLETYCIVEIQTKKEDTITIKAKELNAAILLGIEESKINNENFNIKVKLIRNKYYMKLFDLNNTISKVEKFTEKEIGKNFLLDSYKDLKKIALINYIGTYNFENIIEITKEEMKELRKKSEKENWNYSIDFMGMYIPYVEGGIKEDIIEVLGRSRDKTIIKSYHNLILICQEAIREFCNEHFEAFKDEVNDKFRLYTIIFETVLAHEIGHGVFSYVRDEEDERRANYFASLTFDGTYDKIIKIKTFYQGIKYKTPKLITEMIENEEIIKKEIYKI